MCKAQPWTFPKIRVSLQYAKKYICIPGPNIRISNKDLQFAETASRSCELQGLSHALLGDLCQHRTSADFAFEDFFKDINPLPKGSLEKERDSS